MLDQFHCLTSNLNPAGSAWPEGMIWSNQVCLRSECLKSAVGMLLYLQRDQPFIVVCFWRANLCVRRGFVWKTNKRSGPEELCHTAAHNKDLSSAGGRTVLISYLTVTGQDKCVPSSVLPVLCAPIPAEQAWYQDELGELCLLMLNSYVLCAQFVCVDKEDKWTRWSKDAVGVSEPWHPDSVEGVAVCIVDAAADKHTVKTAPCWLFSNMHTFNVCILQHCPEDCRLLS